MKFTESRLEKLIKDSLKEQSIPHFLGEDIENDLQELIIKDDFHNFIKKKYKKNNITDSEVDFLIKKLNSFSTLDLYESNKKINEIISNGLILKRHDKKLKDTFIELIDYSLNDKNIYKFVTQLSIYGSNKRIPDGIVFINGLPLVVFEFKSAIRENATIYDAFKQLTIRYRRDIPNLLKFNFLCVISDGVNNKVGSLFAPYEFFYQWKKIKGSDVVEKDGIDSLETLIKGLFNRSNLRKVINHFIYFPDRSAFDKKIVPRYPQFYSAIKLYDSILKNQKPVGDGRGGTYSGATGSGKSYTMLYLTRLLMKSIEFSSPTIIIITDRTDLDDQISETFINSKKFIGDENVINVKNREHLRGNLFNIKSGGVFLTTIHKFTEDTKVLSKRDNIICISDEAHRTQINLEQKISLKKNSLQKSFGFAKHLHDSLPNATYVGFTGTPIDQTLDVFGKIVDSYTMKESVKDDITVPLVYEGRAAKVFQDHAAIKKIESFYKQCAEEGSSIYAIEKSKKAVTKMNVILGEPERLKILAKDFVEHYENRISEGSTVAGKAMFVCSNRFIAYDFYKEIIKIRPDWNKSKKIANQKDISNKDKKEIIPLEQIKLIASRDKDDPKKLFDLLGNKKYKKTLDKNFKNIKSNFKIAIVVDMWLTGFDVPFLDTIYIDKPITKHNLIQTISRVNRKFGKKEKGLIVDYIGIKSQMNLALAKYNKNDDQVIEQIEKTVEITKQNLKIINQMFKEFDKSQYFNGSPKEQLNCLRDGAEFIQKTQQFETNFVFYFKRLKGSYDICCSSNKITTSEKNQIYFYIAIKSIITKLTKNNSLDSDGMNLKVRKMIKEVLKADGIEELYKIGNKKQKEINLFDDDYLDKIKKIKLPNTRIKILLDMLSKKISNYKKVNKAKGSDFTKRFETLINKYNDRNEKDILVSDVLDEFSEEIIDLYQNLKTEFSSFSKLGISFNEKSFYDILKSLSIKYDFFYPDEKLIPLSKAVKKIIDNKSKLTDWSRREDIKADLKVDLIILLAEFEYPPIDRDEVYKEIFEQAKNLQISKMV